MENKLLQVIVAFFIPPLAVYLHEGKITKNFWIDLLLCLTWVGGIIFALYIVLT